MREEMMRDEMGWIWENLLGMILMILDTLDTLDILDSDCFIPNAQAPR